MTTYTGEQSVLSAALGPYRRRGFALTALTDDVLVLWYQSTDLAHYTWSATVGEVLEACNTFQAFLDGLASEASSDGGHVGDTDGRKLGPDGCPDGGANLSRGLGTLNPDGLRPYSDYNPSGYNSSYGPSCDPDGGSNVDPDGAKLDPNVDPDGDTLGTPDGLQGIRYVRPDGGSYERPDGDSYSSDGDLIVNPYGFNVGGISYSKLDPDGDSYSPDGCPCEEADVVKLATEAAVLPHRREEAFRTAVVLLNNVYPDGAQLYPDVYPDGTQLPPDGSAILKAAASKLEQTARRYLAQVIIFRRLLSKYHDGGAI